MHLYINGKAAGTIFGFPQKNDPSRSVVRLELLWSDEQYLKYGKYFDDRRKLTFHIAAACVSWRFKGQIKEIDVKAPIDYVRTLILTIHISGTIKITKPSKIVMMQSRPNRLKQEWIKSQLGWAEAKRKRTR